LLSRRKHALGASQDFEVTKADFWVGFFVSLNIVYTVNFCLRCKLFSGGQRRMQNLYHGSGSVMISRSHRSIIA
jgi:hypothetical protein